MLRKFDPSELNEFKAMATDFYFSGAALCVVPESHFERTFSQFFLLDSLCGFAIEVNGELAGYCIIALFWSNEFGGTTAFLDELYIKPAFRGCGVGSGALCDIADFARNRGCLIVRLEVNPSHADTVRLYARNGFQTLDYTQMVRKL